MDATLAVWLSERPVGTPDWMLRLPSGSQAHTLCRAGLRSLPAGAQGGAASLSFWHGPEPGSLGGCAQRVCLGGL